MVSPPEGRGGRRMICRERLTPINLGRGACGDPEAGRGPAVRRMSDLGDRLALTDRFS